MKCVIVALSLLSLQAQASGTCAASIMCKNGSASCSASSTNTGSSNRFDAYCGERHDGDKFLTCWSVGSDGAALIKDIICCDERGNAIQSGWSAGSNVNTAGCVGH